MAVDDKDRNRKQDRRESGQPGGGAGRRDEVGRSGVYPMSGPHPKGDAEIRTQPAWGQGERGAAGYEDHGDSELSYAYGQVLGGLGAGPGGEPAEHGPREIPVEHWRTFFDSFSRQHEGWLVDVEVITDKGRLLEIEDKPLVGVSSDVHQKANRVNISVGQKPDEHLTHEISDVTHVRFLQTKSGADEGLELVVSNGSRVVIRFRAPIRPEMLDGKAA